MSRAELAIAVAAFGDETADIPKVSTPYILPPGIYFSPAVASGAWDVSNEASLSTWPGSTERSILVRCGDSGFASATYSANVTGDGSSLSIGAEQRGLNQLHEHVDNHNMEFLHAVSPFTLDGSHYCYIYRFR